MSNLNENLMKALARIAQSNPSKVDEILRAELVSNTSDYQREDLAELISTLTPTETPMLRMIKKGVATAALHEWVENNLTGVLTGYKLTEAGTPTDVNTTSARRNNNVMAVAGLARASNLVRRFNLVGGDALDRATVHMIETIAKVVEYYMWRGVAGSNECDGIINTLSGHSSGASSTGALPEKDLQNALGAIWERTHGFPTHIFCQQTVAQRIANFTADRIRTVPGGSPAGVDSRALWYMSPFGEMLQVVPVRGEFLASGNVALINMNLLTALFATNPYLEVEDIPADRSDDVARRVKAYFTMEMRNKLSHGLLTGVSSVVS